jgi:hypothetical protein
MLLSDSYSTIHMNVCCYNRCHDNAVKGFWALWNNSCAYASITTLDSLVILDR